MKHVKSVQFDTAMFQWFLHKCSQEMPPLGPIIVEMKERLDRGDSLFRTLDNWTNLNFIKVFDSCQLSAD